MTREALIDLAIGLLVVAICILGCAGALRNN